MNTLCLPPAVSPKACPLFRTFTLIAAILAFATLGAVRVRAQANLTFSGGLGAPLRLTLDAPVTYVITTASSNLNSTLFFDFQGVGNLDFNQSAVSGTITFTRNGGGAQTFTTINSGFNYGSVAAADVYIYGASPGVAVGDTVVLQAGTLTTTSNFAGAPPASGSFQTFIFDADSTKLDAINGVSVVPEPSTVMWLCGAVAGVVGLHFRRRLT